MISLQKYGKGEYDAKLSIYTLLIILNFSDYVKDGSLYLVFTFFKKNIYFEKSFLYYVSIVSFMLCSF